MSTGYDSKTRSHECEEILNAGRHQYIKFLYLQFAFSVAIWICGPSNQYRTTFHWQQPYATALPVSKPVHSVPSRPENHYVKNRNLCETLRCTMLEWESYMGWLHRLTSAELSRGWRVYVQMRRECSDPSGKRDSHANRNKNKSQLGEKSIWAVLELDAYAPGSEVPAHVENPEPTVNTYLERATGKMM